MTSTPTLTTRQAFAFWAVLAVTMISVATAAASRKNSFPLLGDDEPDFAPLRAMIRWDSGWYASIASDGYNYVPNQQSSVAFFPLYPTAIHELTVVGINRWVAGSLITLLAGLGGLLLFRKWASLLKPEHSATAFLMICVYPISFYLYGVVYSDALYLLCAVSAFYSLEKNRPILAAILGALGTACRPIAPALVMGLLVRSLEKRLRSGEKIRVIDVVPALAGLGLLSYMTFLYWRFNDPIAFAHVQGAPGWDQMPGPHTWFKITWFETVFAHPTELVAVRLASHAFLTILALVLVVPTWKRLGWGYGTYCLLAVGLPAISTKDFMGLGRYLIAAFPLFLTGASIVDQRPKVRTAILLISLIIFLRLSWAWGSGGYIS